MSGARNALSIRLGIVCALPSEARALGVPARDTAAALAPGRPISEAPTIERGTLLVSCNGMGPARAIHAAEALLTAGVDALVSFGLAGGLDPALRAGTILLPRLVATREHGTFCCDALLRSRVADALADGARGDHGAAAEVVDAPLFTTSRPLATPSDKAAARAMAAAPASVDMESAAVGRVAAERGVPFAVARVVVDAADVAIPRAAVGALDADGRFAPLRLVTALARRPADLLGLLRLARSSGRAHQALRRLAVVLARPAVGNQPG
jgi:adenosylhomocysteine nucleosidase